MSDRLDDIKNYMRELVEQEPLDADGDADVFMTFVESQDLSSAELRELCQWMSDRGAPDDATERASQRAEQALREIREFSKPGETISDVFPRLPPHLKHFIRATRHEKKWADWVKLGWKN